MARSRRAPERHVVDRASRVSLPLARWALLLGSALLAAALARGAIALGATIDDGERVYSVGQVRAHLADQPHQWLGRTVRVRGMLVGCPSPGAMGCGPTAWQPGLADPAGPGARDPLPVRWGGPEPVLSSLRAMPLVGRFVPRPQTARWGVLATYRVRLRVAAAHTLCLSAVCYEAVLLDA